LLNVWRLLLRAVAAEIETDIIALLHLHRTVRTLTAAAALGRRGRKLLFDRSAIGRRYPLLVEACRFPMIWESPRSVDG